MYVCTMAACIASGNKTARRKLKTQELEERTNEMKYNKNSNTNNNEEKKR